MNNGNDNDIIWRSQKAVQQLASCGMSYSAHDVKTLIQYAKALDKNQKTLIKLILKLQRTNKGLFKVSDYMYAMLNPEQRRIIDKYKEEVTAEYDPT